MSRLFYREKPAAMPEKASSEPKIIREVVSEKIELRGVAGKDGKDGKDGRDGVSAFPTHVARINLTYHQSSLVPGKFDLISVSGADDACIIRADLGGIVLKAGHYRITTTGAPHTFYPFGAFVGIFKSDTDFTPDGAIPAALAMNARSVRTTGDTFFEAQVIVEYVA